MVTDDLSTSGSESDNEDELFTPHQHRRRMSGFELPDTVTTLRTEQGSKVFVVGTAHFSENSQQDVAKVCIKLNFYSCAFGP